jgi:hypothetical protein
MIRKLAATVTAIVTASLALASTAFARIPLEVGSGAPSSSTSTGGGTPWGDIALGVVAAAVVVAIVAGAALYGRMRRGSAAFQV